ncbi:MAG: hypothetical protein AB1752_10840 [Candidatus Zixiibacteriota bacterium]
MRPRGTISISLALIAMTLFLGMPALAQDVSGTPDTAQLPLPRFFQIPDWEARSRLPEATASGLRDRAEFAVAALKQYSGAMGTAGATPRLGLSPLEWPVVFAGERISPRRLRREIEQGMRDAGVAFREIIAFEGAISADSIARSIADGHPVLLNAPDAPILYGYDRREPDTWWWMQSGSQSEILLESERQARFVYWADDPASNIAWSVTGVAPEESPMELEESEFQFLAVIDRSVQGDATVGLRPYPLSVRAFHDSLASAAEMPALRADAPETDPLGIRRAIDARSQVSSLLETLTLRMVDTTISQPLRLALYFYHNSIESLKKLESFLYEGNPESTLVERCRNNWSNDVRRPQAADAAGSILEWERQAAEQVSLALAARNPRRR